MKRLLFCVFTATALMACSNDPDSVPEPNGDNGAIKVSALIANVKPADRTTISGTTGAAAWADGDAIGLFCPEAKLSASNVSYTVSGVSTTPAWATGTPIYWANASVKHKFLAYYPYASGNTASGSVKLPALTPQTGTIAPTQDFLISNNLGSTGIARTSDGSIGLAFTHAFALLHFQITINSSIASGTTLKSVTLTGGTSDKIFTTDANSTIDLSTGTITAGGTTDKTITATPSTAPTLSSTVTNFFVIIMPGTYTAPTLQIVITEGVTDITVPSASIVTTVFATASKYAYTVNISRTAITVSNPTITDWTPVSSGTISGGI